MDSYKSKRIICECVGTARVLTEQFFVAAASMRAPNVIDQEKRLKVLH